MTAPPKLRIAVSGGGLAGAAILNALYRQEHLDVQIYESAPAFSERGQAVGLSVNAQRALERLVPDLNLFLANAKAVDMHSSRLIMGGGPHAGEHVLDINDELPTRIMHRAELLHTLLEPIPRSSMHAGKKLASIHQASPNDHGLILTFEDGSTTEADAVIGADGIFSFVREYVLGKDHPNVKPIPAGWRNSMCLVPFEKAVAALGKERFIEDRQYGYTGQYGFIMHDVLNNGELVQCVAAYPDPDTTAERKTSVDRKELEGLFESWLDGPVAKGMIDLLLTQDEPAAYAQWEHKDAPTFARDNVLIAGDAAHAMTPWQGSGAGQALEDAVVLGALFAQIRNVEQIPAAFRAFDVTRRPRAQRIAASSRATGRMMTGLDPEVPDDPKMLHDALEGRWRYIFDFDLGKHVEEAVRALSTELK